MIRHRLFTEKCLTRLVAGFVAVVLLSVEMSAQAPLGFRRASFLTDISGLAWIDGDRFLAVHDAKADDEKLDPRISILYLPSNDTGIRFRSRSLRYRGELSNDLESIAAIPGTNQYLLCESGDSDFDGSDDELRIYKVEVVRNSVRILDRINWPAPIFNVEATTIGKLGDAYVFIYAERAEGEPTTEVNWAPFNPNDLTFGEFQSVTYENPDPDSFNRAIVGFSLSSDNEIYSVASYDPDVDNGPFAGGVYRIGVLEDDGGPVITLYDDPVLEGIIDGFKSESIAIRETQADGLEIFVGFDDENFGGTIRQMP
ncbi:MAG: hypothetical protein AAFX93_09565 [Verrucomicrobiota bacterium]